MPELPSRPVPAVPWRGRVTTWIEWVGRGRLVAGALVALAVIAGAYWLVAPPAPPVESTLPYASTPSESVPLASVGVSSTEVVVHVAGAVRVPGVYTLARGSRVVDAVDAAGGFALDARADAVNLATIVSDGERIYVPRWGEDVPADPVAPSGSSTAEAPQLVDLNRATAAELEQLPGIGPTTAAAIVAHRDEVGPFTTIDDLADVAGIGPAKLAALRDLVTV